MNRTTWLIGAAVVVLVGVGVGVVLAQAAGPAETGVLQVAGNVRADIVTVQAPAIVYPTPDYTVGIPVKRTPGQMPAAAKRATPSGASRQPVVSGLLARVLVTEGDKVAAGQTLAELDTAMLDLGVAQARTAAVTARANVRVMDDSIHTVDTARAKLRTARAKLVKARSQILSGRSQLVAQLAQLEAALAHMPPGPLPPGSPPSPAVLIPQLKAALAKLDAGLSKMNKGLKQLDSGAAKLSDARRQLVDAKELLGILADGQDVGVQAAEARRSFAIIKAPVAGTVTFARRSGTVAMVGSPVVRILEGGPSHIVTYLTPEQLASVSAGARAQVGYDSAPGVSLPGRVTTIGDEAVFPPTSFPTGIVHMTRTVRVTVTLDASVTAPPGTPVDLTIRTGRP